MLVRMVRARAWQHVGREQVLSVGQTYELPESIGRSLVQDGSAVLAKMQAPETKAERRRG